MSDTRMDSLLRSSIAYKLQLVKDSTGIFDASVVMDERLELVSKSTQEIVFANKSELLIWIEENYVPTHKNVAKFILKINKEGSGRGKEILVSKPIEVMGETHTLIVSRVIFAFKR